jgi:BirA family biotin operon repressor/biotin-[acetyl-CoA-carboxylase] ligase
MCAVFDPGRVNPIWSRAMATMNVGRVREELRTKLVGRSIIFRHAVASTNVLAKELASLGAQDGTVIIAETQTCGRGRLGSEWVSPAGGLWFSVVLTPGVEPSAASRLVFVAGLAVAKALRELYGLDVAVKWPNDVLVCGKKVSGILAEMSTRGQGADHVVLGIGVNANFEVSILPERLWRNATSLRTELGRRINLERLLGVILEELEGAYDLFLNGQFAFVLEEWKGFARFLGSEVEVASAGEDLVGLALDVDGDGALVLRLEDGMLRRVFVGDVSVRVK